MATYTIIYGVLGLAILVTELIGVASDRKGDTISEHYWWIQGKFPVITRVLMTAFLVWLGIHFMYITTEAEVPVNPTPVEVTVVVENP